MMELPTPESLKKKRIKLGLTQSELAGRAGVSQPLIARIESGDVDPRLSTIKSIITALEDMEKSRIMAKDLMTFPVISLPPDETVEHAVKLMEKHGFSQLPVLENGVPVGSISENALVQAMGSRDIDRISNARVRELMEDSFPAVAPGTDMGTISALLETNHAVLVMEMGKVVGVITKYNIMRLINK
jgi:predicted transcriptional regulator